MPSVFIAPHNSGAPLPSFSAKGIADQMPGVIGDVPIFVEAPLTLYPHGIFQEIIFSIMTWTSTIITEIRRSFNVFKPIHSPARIFEVPVATFRFKSLSPAEIAELKGMGLQQDLTNANLFVGTPAIHNLARLNALRPQEDRIRPGHVNFDAFFAWVYLLKGIQIFVTSHNAKQGYQVVVAKGSGKEISKTGKEYAAVQTGSDIMDLDDGEAALERYDPQAFYMNKTVTDLSAFPGKYHDIDRDTTTFTDGIFFPFFPGMSTADKTTASSVFSEFFANTISANPDADAKFRNKIRHGTRQLAFTRSGMIMAHVYRVFELATHVPASTITIILKGSSYMGTVIEGNFAIRMHGNLVESGDLAEDIAKLNLLESQADRMCELLNSVENDKGVRVYFFTRIDFMRSRSALRCFISVNPDLFHSSDNYASARDLLISMDFGDVFPLPTQELLLVALRYMSTGQAGLLDQYPAFLGANVLHSRSRTSEALSMFGPRAPTLNVGDSKGTQFTFPHAGKEDKNLTKVEGVRPLHYFPLWVVPTNVAVSQWEKIFSNGGFSIPKGRKKKEEFTDLHRVVFSVAQDPLFSEMYSLLKGMTNEARAKGNTGAAGRKRGRDDDDGSKGKKKARTDFDDDL